MNTLWDCFLIVGGSTLLSVAGMFLVRKSVSRQTLESCHEVGGFLLAIIGTLYAILVGLIVVNSQAKVDAASDMSVTEANRLSHIFHMASTFKEPGRQKIRSDIHMYALAAVKQDWSKVEDGAEKEATIGPYRHLWRDVTAYVPEGDKESECYSKILDDLEELSDARKYRMVAARGGLSSVLWSVLICGGIMLVLFTYFFFVESLLSQALMTACVAVFLSMNVFLIYIFQNPYRPELGAKEAGFGFSFNPNWFVEPLSEPKNLKESNDLKEETKGLNETNKTNK